MAHYLFCSSGFDGFRDSLPIAILKEGHQSRVNLQRGLIKYQSYYSTLGSTVVHNEANHLWL